MEPIRYGSLQTPIGEVFVAATDDGVCRVSYGRPAESFAAEVAAEFGAPAVRDGSAGPVRAALLQLEEYFAGRRRSFELPLDLSGQTDFQRAVLETVAAIPFGQVESYGEVAERAGVPQGARAVGGVMRQNPLPLIVPCHRVVRSDGRLGGFTGGLGHKVRLLELEGLRVEGEVSAGARVAAD